MERAVLSEPRPHQGTAPVSADGGPCPASLRPGRPRLHGAPHAQQGWTCEPGKVFGAGLRAVGDEEDGFIVPVSFSDSALVRLPFCIYVIILEKMSFFPVFLVSVCRMLFLWRHMKAAGFFE